MPYSKWQSLTAAPLGFTVAFNVAEVCVVTTTPRRSRPSGGSAAS